MQTTAAEVAAAEDRIKAAAEAAAATAAQAFPKGTKVTLNFSNDNVPEGTVGTVLRIKEDGYMAVSFPSGEWGVPPTSLRRA